MSVARFEDLDLSKQYTYADYLSWQFAERVELLRGWVAKISPAPNRKQQRVSGELHFLIKGQLQKSNRNLYAAPFDVRLPRTNGGESVVQPNLCIICDQDKLTEQGCIGAPDWIIEILSPGNSKRELRNKYDLYEESGVREYWLVHPLEEVLFRYVLRNGSYIGLKPITIDSEPVASEVLPEVELKLSEILA